jgi:putative hydrolase of the HAD superfamily
VGIEKPDRRIFDLALDRLGLDADEVVYVGDSWEIDVVGARNAGISPIYLSAAPREGATCITGICELPAALDRAGFAARGCARRRPEGMRRWADVLVRS